MEYKVYCDESCYLLNDHINVMALGAVWYPSASMKRINDRIKQIKLRNDIPEKIEVKWTKASPSKEQLYFDLINYFFDESDLHFRGIVVPNKQGLDHKKFNQTHDDWYYKMYFETIKIIINPHDTYQIFLDYRDKNSYSQSQILHQVVCNASYDFSKNIIKTIQPIRSEEVQIMQLVDILTGAIAHRNRVFDDGLARSEAKQKIIDLISERSGYSLDRTTLYREDKLNLLIWEAR